MPSRRKHSASYEKARREKVREVVSRARAQEETEGVFYCRVPEPDPGVETGEDCAVHQVAAGVVDGEWVWSCTVCKARV